MVGRNLVYMFILICLLLSGYASVDYLENGHRGTIINQSKNSNTEAQKKYFGISHSWMRQK